jgi:homoserine O-succinyltransferase/O-acetyltransferase
VPLCPNSRKCSHDRLRDTEVGSGKLSPTSPERSSRCITIGLINNMPDAALETTERQFRSLLASASEGITVRLSLYSLTGVPRAESGRRHIADHYSSVEELWDTSLDGLIVTGAEPQTDDLKDEPYWKSFTRVLEWASANTYSTVFSCLAAHAAILQMDGIGRRKSDDKHFGVFDCARVCNHQLMVGTSTRFKLPHSRWNGIAEDELTASGYSVLTRSEDAGVDMFVKQHKALFVFLQGHPEYESDTLSREYRRDVGRYLRGETDRYPTMPQGYFDGDTAQALAALRGEAMSRRSEELLTYVSTTLEHGAITNTWHSTATCIYRNWLQYIRDQKEAERHHHRTGANANVSGVEGLMSSRELTQIDGIVQRP